MNDHGEYESSEDREFHAIMRASRRARHENSQKLKWEKWPEEMARKNFQDRKHGGREKAIEILGQAEVDRLDAEALAKWEADRAEDEYYAKM
jgi:hypothetical protein